MENAQSGRGGRLRFALLALLSLAALLSGIGMREPVPPDEPRFTLAARQMVESGQWLFPRRGSELYADKPPMFMWLQALSYQVTGNWRVAFLLPSFLAAALTLWLTWDLARRLWGRRAARYASTALFVSLQFGLQAKHAQIDMVLVAMMVLSLWALLRYLLLGKDWRLLALGAFAAGLGTVTKGVGFLPLLVFFPWMLVSRMKSVERRPKSGSMRHAPIAVAAVIVGGGVWLAPMVWTVSASDDPVLRAYADEILWQQTATRYADPWHHLKPFWYYLKVIPALWLPGVLLLPWLLPAWWRRLQRGDRRLWLLLGWGLLVLLFFTISPGKRGVYVFPILPALCVAAGALLPALLRRRGPRRLLSVYMWSLALILIVPGALLLGDASWSRDLAPLRDIDASAHSGIGVWLLGSGLLVSALSVWGRGHRCGTAVVAATGVLWVCYGAGVMPAMSDSRSSAAVMRAVGERIGPDAELAMIGWREQNLLQADRDVVDFGFQRPWHLQWREAGPWLAADPARRWLFVLEEAVGPCVDRAQAVRIGVSNRRTWWLVPAQAWIPACTTPPFGTDGDAL